jgi:putative membrane protein insertion efficiency factor
MKQAFLFFIRLYRFVLRPILPPACRFYPSCSDYAFESISKFGAFKGSIMALKRLLKCHPFNEGGFDPVPHIECDKGSER